MSEATRGPGEIRVERDPEQAEVIRRYEDAFVWFHQQFDLCEKYAGQVVIIHERQVVGSGAEADGARAAAKRFFEERGEPMPPPQDLAVLIAPESIWLDPPLPYAPAGSSPPAKVSGDRGER